MENKIKLRVCIGTYCYVMGGYELKDIKGQLPDDLKDKVYVEASICLGCDSSGSEPQPPYVEIDGELIPYANVEKIISNLRMKLKTSNTHI
jgi:NADH:ubiquinone oxidoreductase subunit E